MNYDSRESFSPRTHVMVAVATPMVLIAWVMLLFAPALPGILHFDDLGNLAGLATIHDLGSGWRWMREGHAGPLGRPLTLATFALQYYQWPHPEPFLQWNIALHAINALLVYWLALLVLQRLGKSGRQQLAIGFFVALTWAALPLLNTSVLFIVQRMTLLSAAFLLAGLIAWLKLRGPADAAWPRQLAALLAAAAGGVLALLAKESGALIVAYALVLEFVVVVTAGRRRPTFSIFVLTLANGLLLVGLLRYVNWSTCTELQRGFTMVERLGSQAIMLLAYLKTLVVPVAADLNPFRFQDLPQGMDSMRWFAIGWLALMIAPWLIWRLGWRLPALALAWFLYGHIMESGWIALEPYFAHRNYLPAAGLVFLLVVWVFSLKQATLWRSACVAWVLVLATVTWMNTSLWGNRELASEIWVKEEPRSTRAAMNLAHSLEATRGLATAQRFLDRFVAEERDLVGFRLQSLVSACVLDPDTDHSTLVSHITQAIHSLPYEGWATDQLQNLITVVQKRACRGVSMTEVAHIAAAFLDQPAYRCSRPITSNMLSVLGVAALERHENAEAMDFFIKSLQQSATYAIANLYLDLAQQEGDIAGVRQLQTLVANAPVPGRTTPQEWQELGERVDVALRQMEATRGK